MLTGRVTHSSARKELEDRLRSHVKASGAICGLLLFIFHNLISILHFAKSNSCKWKKKRKRQCSNHSLFSLTQELSCERSHFNFLILGQYLIPYYRWHYRSLQETKKLFSAYICKRWWNKHESVTDSSPGSATAVSALRYSLRWRFRYIFCAFLTLLHLHTKNSSQ